MVASAMFKCLKRKWKKHIFCMENVKIPKSLQIEARSRTLVYGKSSSNSVNFQLHEATKNSQHHVVLLNRPSQTLNWTDFQKVYSNFWITKEILKGQNRTTNSTDFCVFQPNRVIFRKFQKLKSSSIDGFNFSWQFGGIISDRSL